MVHHRKQVCPVFATTTIDSVAIDNLEENAVPDILIQGACLLYTSDAADEL